MPNQNKPTEEWREELNKKSEFWGNCTELEDFIASQISQAEQRGKQEGLKMALKAYEQLIGASETSKQEFMEAVEKFLKK